MSGATTLQTTCRYSTPRLRNDSRLDRYDLFVDLEAGLADDAGFSHLGFVVLARNESVRRVDRRLPGNDGHFIGIVDSSIHSSEQCSL